MPASRRTLSALAAVLAATATVVAAPAAQAAAAGSCGSTAKVAFTPGLSLFAKAVTTKVTAGKLTACTGPVAPTPTAKFSGTLKSTAAGQACGSGTAKGTLTITWANGQVSKASVTQTPNAATTTQWDTVIAGAITSGPGLAQSASIRAVLTVTPTSGDCLFAALTAGTLAGPIAITVP